MALVTPLRRRRPGRSMVSSMRGNAARACGVGGLDAVAEQVAGRGAGEGGGEGVAAGGGHGDGLLGAEVDAVAQQWRVVWPVIGRGDGDGLVGGRDGRGGGTLVMRGPTPMPATELAAPGVRPAALVEAAQLRESLLSGVASISSRDGPVPSGVTGQGATST